MAVGNFAIILQLTSRPDLVRQTVKLVCFDEGTSRFGCRLTTGETLGIKAENLQPLFGAFADAARALFTE